MCAEVCPGQGCRVTSIVVINIIASRYYIMDEGTMNGTFLNGTRLSLQKVVSERFPFSSSYSKLASKCICHFFNAQVVFFLRSLSTLYSGKYASQHYPHTFSVCVVQPKFSDYLNNLSLLRPTPHKPQI